MRWGTRRIAVATGVYALVAALVAAAPVSAAKGKRKIHVRPGQDAISRALARADDGDVLRIHKGRYREELTVDKRVTLMAAGKRRPVIDGDCATRATIEAQTDRVRLRRLKVVGGSAIEVDFNGVSGGRASELIVRDTCDAEYGINLFDTGATAIVKSRAFGFHDAGFYIGEISSTPTGPIRLRRSESYANLRGVIVENSSGGDIRVTRNDLHDNNIFFGPAQPTGILITNSDGVLVKANDVADNAMVGLDITADSAGNRINHNIFVGNRIDIRNQGDGTCGSGNIVTTGDAIPPC